MARTTKLELEQALIASQRDNAALREQISVLRAELERAKPAVRSDWPTAPRAKVPAHFAAARELAMRTGRSVRVSA